MIVGVVDKFTGSSVFAFFGLPTQSPLDTEKALLAGLAIKSACTSLNLKFNMEGLPVMKFGIGMSTEPAVSAVVGGGVQFEYTVIGGKY